MQRMLHLEYDWKIKVHLSCFDPFIAVLASLLFQVAQVGVRSC